MSEALFDDAHETVPKIAVVGLAGRFPGARTVAELWRNLRAGIESVSSFTMDELAASGIEPRLLADPRYVRAKGVLADADLFDAALFGFTPREAEHMDPQHRVFLECAWEALEDAGCDPQRYAGRAGVYAGCGANTYLLFNLLPHRELMETLGVLQLLLLNDRDFLATRVSHKLDLRGPSVAVQTACSTSLVAIHLACQALLTGECDLALAGGVSISTPLVSGYLHQEGSVLSPDGHCRAFDAAAAGTVEGNGCGVVVLKRLADALADGDRIRAVVRGSAVTNDGASRVGFTAPSVDGQAAAISEALLLSGVDPDTIGYVETHGSGTPLGDPIEIEALTQAFRRAGTRGTASCAIGSAKTNLGHCNSAAGVAGFLKAVLALENRTLPPSLHFERPNPRIDFAASPFRVVTACAPWEAAESPRRAGVSSFGLGGTNAHAVLEEAPVPEPGDPPLRPAQLLVLSAHTPEVLDAATVRLAEHLEVHPDPGTAGLADVAWTLQVGRRGLEHRRAVVARDREAAVAALRDSVGTAPGYCEEPGRRSVVFLFPGLGDQSVDMARELYETEPVFREQVDLCAGKLTGNLGCDLREVLFSQDGWSPTVSSNLRRGPDLRAMLRRDGPAESPAATRLRQTLFAQPVCFVVEYALARLLMHWGVAPRAMIGYSIGEYVAACLAGVLSLDDALSLVVRRAKLIQDLPPGAMLAVPLAEEMVLPLLDGWDGRLSVCATNGPHFCVVGGPEDAVGELERELAGRGASCIRLQTTHAFHSAMMDPAADALTAMAGPIMGTTETRPPRIPYLSNVTGTWITQEDLADPAYWARHMRGTVRFAEGLGELLRESGRVYLEIGPGATLGTLVRQHPDAAAGLLTVPTLGHGGDTEDLLLAAGRLWEAGVEIDWERFHGGERRFRVPLPTYPFERQRFWVDPPRAADLHLPMAETGAATAERLPAQESTAHRRPGLSTPYVAPRDETEESLAAIWEDLFGFAPIGIEDSFLELGGQSLLAIQLIARIHTAFGVSLTAAALFEAPTVAGLAAEVARARGEKTPEELEELLALVEGLSPEEAGRRLASLPEEVPQPPPVALRSDPPPARASRTPEGIPRVSGPGGAGDWPLSFDQERLWFLSLLDPQGTVYNMTTATRLQGRLDVSALVWAFDEVLRRQGAWRATFPAVAGSPVQRIAAEAHLPLPIVDLSTLPDVTRAAAVLELTALAARQPFALDRGPLLRASLIRLGEREHVCLLAVHHIASDWLTLQLFWSELAALYPARLAGRAAALPELPIQYPDFVLWQRARLQGEALDRQLAGWMERLRDFPLVLDLPADRPRPATESMRGGRHPARLGPETTGRLRELARREGATRFMLVTALCAALCHRLSGQEKLILGTLNANRNRPELQPLFGFFLTQLPLAVDLTGDPPLRELLARVRAVAVQAYAHPDLPFGKLVEALQPERELGRMPVVQVLVQLIEHQSAAGQNLGDLRLEPLDIHDGNARYDLLFSLFEDADSIHGPFEYNSEIFDAATAARMLELFHTMAESAAADPSLRVSELPAFSAAARQQVLLEWNDTATEDPAPPTVVELFAAQAARTPEAVAWTGGGWRLTYADLDERSARLARHLHRLGVGAEDLVGIYLERTIEVPVALLGVLRSGAAYLPLDPAHPAERRAFLLEDAGAVLVLTQERLLPGLPAGARSVCLDSGWSGIAGEPASPPRVRIEPESRAYVIYTSGSTGAPKGAEIPHRALANFVRAMRRLYTVEAGDAMPAITTIAFDLSVPELYLPMLGGGTTPLLGRDTAADGTLLARALDDCGATVFQATPATYRMLLESGWLGRSELLLLCGAEPLHRDLADRLLPLGRGLWNFYGPTETTVWSTAWKVEDRGPISLGRPIAETRIHLLDRRLAPVPLGAIGEICIGSAGLARGYLRRPDLTAERFVPDPFSGAPGARLYRTGDLGRHRPDGRLDHLGRADHQVKLRGFRIEPGEIEAALRGHPAVAEAVVLLREERPGDPRLVAWLETAPGAVAPTVAELRDLLRRRLPDYMVPAVFVPLPALPRNANGKLDRRALPAPEGLAARPGAEPVAPRDEIEAEVMAIWQRLLEVERVGVDDDFFELGGHSLLANRVLAAVRDRFEAEIPLRALFQAPTVAGVAAAVRQARASADSGGLSRIERQPRRFGPRSSGIAERFPVSFSQLREWILDRLEPGTPAYNVPAPTRVAGPLSIPLLAASLRELVRRHESLRTTFEAGPEEPLQVVAPRLDLPLPVIDLEALPGATREPELRRLLAEDLGLGLDLAAGPLLRARAVRLGPEDHAVLFTIHHIVSDGWSIGVFLRELGEVYEAFSQGRPSPLPELPVQYPDYAVWQRQRLRGELLDEQVRWWRGQLAGAPPLLELPTDRPRPPVRSSHGAELPVTLPRSLAEPLQALAARQGTSLFAALLAGFQALLARLSGQEDVCAGTFASNRPRTELEGLIGFFVNTLALRTDLSGDPSFRELTARVREVALGVYAHQEIPFEKLLEALDVPRDPSRTPLFQVMLVLLSFPRQRIDLSRITLAPLTFEARRANFDLTLWLAEGPGGLGGYVDFSTDLFEPATVARMMGHLRTLLEGAVADPERRLWSLPLLAPEERAEILEGWSRTVEEPPGPPLLHRLVEAWAKRTPHAVAVETADGGRLTYEELDTRAERLARHLRRLGVGPEARVGLAVERSPEMLVGMLAVLKAGGAYMPLDPAYPQDRLEFMLEDSGATVLLLQEQLAGRIPAGRARVVPLDGLNDFPPGGQGGEGALDPDNPAYVIYTSGSTGRPKGVVVAHRAIAAYVRTAREYYAMGPADRVLQLGSISFDTSAEEIYPALAAGATVVLRSAGMVVSMRHFLSELDRLGITLLALQTAFWHEIVAGLIEGLDLPASLRLVAFGGEAALLDRVEAWRRRVGREVRLVNTYGPTEATIVSTYRELAEPEDDPEIPIGRPIPGACVYVVDRRFDPAPPGVAGELMIGGAGLARGYLSRPDLTAERFVPDPFAGIPGARLYRTGDLARFRAGGDLLFCGRADRQLKLRGFRIEPGEIEAALRLHPALHDAVADLRGKGEDGRLMAWVVARAGVEAPGVAELRAFLRDRLPEPMVPSLFVPVPALPLTPSGKLDRRALPAPEGLRPGPSGRYAAPTSALERTVAGIFAELLRVDRVGRDDNFFDLGGHSLLVVRAHQRLCQALGREIPVVDLFRFPTVALLARHLGQTGEDDDPSLWRVQVLAGRRKAVQTDRIAILGMAGRFPGARNVEELWARLRDGVDCIRDLTDEDLRESGLDPTALPQGYVRRAAVVDDVELFDASFFGYSPEEAEILDPQLRLFLECAWEALESAAWVPDEAQPEQVGLFAGTGLPAYLMSNLLPHPRIQETVDPTRLLLANDRDYFVSRVAYELDLRGPALGVQSASSTSLAAVHLACQSLLSGQCTLAIAGGVRIAVPQKAGYVARDGMLPPDGRCRAFDAGGRGALSGSGVGVVVLKRLEDALADGDPIHAVILGSACNNDGALRVGYAAPSVEGQAEAVALAQAMAGVAPETLGYVEAHGSGTPLGDPIEVAALTRAFRASTRARGFCALGSIKTNVGHLESAAGVAGLIKAALAVERGQIPPSLHFETPNPEIDFASSPFYVNTRLQEWPRHEVSQGPRRAGVSSFGMGGTNVHVVIEEPPEHDSPDPSSPWQLLVLSARTAAALERRTDDLADWLEAHPDADLADVAHTLQVGRRAFPYRRALVCCGREDALPALRSRDPLRLLNGVLDESAGRPEPQPDDLQEGSAVLLDALARQWLAGQPIDWTRFAAPGRRRKLRLPTYPFERKRCWVDRPVRQGIPVVVRD